MALLRLSRAAPRGLWNPFKLSFNRKFHSHAGLMATAMEEGLLEITVQDILKVNDKWRHMWTVDENETVFEATRQMVDFKLGSLCVTKSGKVVGIVTERDYLRKVVHEGRTSMDTKVGEISTMGNKLICASPTDSLQDCVDIMAIKDIRHLPVSQSDGEVVGLLSIKDIARAFSNERSTVLSTLEEIRESRMPIHDG